RGGEAASAGRVTDAVSRAARARALRALRTAPDRSLGKGRRRGASLRRSPRRAPGCLRPRRPVRRALSLRVGGDGVGGARPARRVPAALGAGGTGATPLRA